MSKLSAFKTHREGHIQLQLKGGLMLQKTTKVMEILLIAFFTIPSKEEIIAPVRLMFIDLQRFPQILLISALLKGYHLLETMGDF